MGNKNSTGFALNIIIVGKPSYQQVSRLLGNISLISNDSIKIQEKTYKIKLNKTLNWKYFIMSDKFTDETLDSIIEIIKYNYDNFLKKNVIICFLNFEESLKLLDKFTSIHENYHPFFIFVSEKFSQNNLITQVNSNICPSPQGNNSQIDFRNVFVEKWIEKDNSPTLNRLLKICSYYNELGDTFDLPNNSNFKLTEKKFLFFSYRINFMVCGGTGVGKSTLINLLLQEKKSLAGEGFSQTSKIIKYNHNQYPISIYDTPGFTLGKNDEVKLTMEKIKELNVGLKEEKNQIHCILYLINSQSARTLEGIEIDFIKFLINDFDIPIYFVLTRIFDEKFGNQFKKELENSLFQIFKDKKEIFDKIKNKIFLTDLVKIKGINELLDNIYNDLSESKVDLVNFTRLNDENDLEQIKSLTKNSIFFKNLTCPEDFITFKRPIATSIILSYSLLNILCGAEPLPIVDVALVTTIQITMVGCLTLLYKKVFIKDDSNPEETLQALGSQTLANAGFNIAKAQGGAALIGELASTLKSIPVFGTTIGGIIGGSVSGISTGFMGYNIIKIFEKEFLKRPGSEIFKEAAECFNNGVDGIKKIKEFYNIKNK